MLLLAASTMMISCGSNSKADADDLAPGTAAFSIAYASSSESAGKIVGHYRVHAVDDQGKPLSGLKLKMSLINGVKKIRNTKLQRARGNILSTTPIRFNDLGVNFAQAGVGRGDTLIVLPSEGKTDISYLGDWTISNVGADLELKENSYHLETTENLTYIIGNEERLLGGKNGDRGVIAVAHIQDVNNTFVTDEKGYTFFDVVFDPVLAAHTITVGVHTVNGARRGAAKVIGLRGADFPPVEVTVLVPSTTTGGCGTTPCSTSSTTVSIPVSMTLSIDPGNGGSEHLIGVDVSPASFTVEPIESCALNYKESNFHTDSGGRVHLVINAIGKREVVDGNTTETTGTDTCTIKWNGGVSSTYLEY